MITDVPTLKSFGPRIIILGASNAGKSTLAIALNRKCGYEVIHLDRFRHLPNTNWHHRPDAEFAALHSAALTQERWIMDGNYTNLLPERLERATGAIVLTAHAGLRFFRYLRRTIQNSPERAGHLEGAQDSLKWGMVDWVLFKSGKRINGYIDTLRASGKPLIFCRSTPELKRLYQHWNL